MKKYIMSLDQGTTSSRCMIFDHDGKIVSSAKKEFKQIYPMPGYVEHDPEEIFSSQYEVAISAMKKARISYKDIKALGIANQRETTIVWDKKTGKPVYNAIVWQCRRTSYIIDGLTEKDREYIKNTTGLVPDAYFSASKIKWILENVEGAKEKAKEGRLLFGTVDTWLMWKLTGGRVHATDHTNASRTMLFDIKKLKWDKKLLKMFDIPEVMMPDVHPSGFMYGKTSKAFWGGNIPICGIAGDQQASLFGLGCFNKGDIKCTYGTGCFMLMNTADEFVRSEHGLVTTLVCTFDDVPRYALEGSVFMGGAVMQWLRDEMKMINKVELSENAIKKVNDTEGVYIVPAFSGLGAPYWDQDARGVIVGITRGFGRKHMIRACLESIAYQVLDVLDAMIKDAASGPCKFIVDGGASRNDFLMQFQADLIGLSVIRPEMVENTAKGAAFIAGLTSGFWKDKDEISKNTVINKEFSPCITKEKRREMKKGWHRAVKTAISWSKA